MATTGRVTLAEGVSFRATTGSGHALTIDAAPEVGGADRGPRPMELLLLGLGGCTAIDVLMILRKMRQNVVDYEVRVAGERQDEHPRIFTSIELEHVVRGRDLNEASVRRAIELSATTYCSAAAMLGARARIVDTYRLIDEASGEERIGRIAPSE